VKLRSSEVRYRRLFETAQDGILLLDGISGEITDANPFILSMLGYPLKELMGKRLWEIGPFQDVENSRAAFGILQHEDYIRYEDLPLQSKSGKQVDVEFVSNAYLVDGVRVIQCNIREIGERKRAERESRASNLQLQRVLAQGATIFYSIVLSGEANGQFSYISENIEKVLGYRVAEAMHPRWWAERIHQEDAPNAISGRVELLERGYASNTYRFRHQDGSYRWLRDEQRLFRDSQGNPVEIAGSWADITERKSLEDQLRQAMKMEAIGRLAGGIAHDFNNLLSVIIGYSQIMRQQDALPRDTREQSEQIYLAAQRAARLTRQLLSFSRKQLLHLRTADLNLVVTGISKMLQRVIGEDISLKLECSSELLLVDADENLLEQVLTNLAVNARDSMPKGGRLTISTGRVHIEKSSIRGRMNERCGDFVSVRVRDNGTGMTAQTQSRIFEPFFTTKDVGKGTGLGLPTAYGIIRQHLGWIEVESELGAGSTFTIYLPAALSLQAPAVPPLAAGKALPSGNETILLVEDELALQTMTARVLRNLGYRVLVANDGHAAMLKWAEHQQPIDLLLTDIVMPGGLSGTELAQKLRQVAPDLRIVLMSGYTTEAPKSSETTQGIIFLSKPYTLEEMAGAVRSSLDEAKQTSPNARTTAPWGVPVS
jgi:two-component system cell cycle sensor histidine kinase/response regulator CckA